MDEEIITPIGTLEWNVGTIYNMPAYLESMRPTVKEDMEDYSTRYASACEIPDCKVGASDEDVIMTSVQTMMDVIAHVTKMMEGDGIDGLVRLCFATHQLGWNIKIVCHAYVPEPKRV